MIDTRTGTLYPSLVEAKDAGVPLGALVAVTGSPANIERVAAAVRKVRRRANNKAARQARRRNRQ